MLVAQLTEYTTTQVALLLGLSDASVRYLVGNGTIPARKDLNGRYKFDKQLIDELAARRPKTT